jgi:hypothetical protein
MSQHRRLRLSRLFVIPAKAGIQDSNAAAVYPWVPAYAGTTNPLVLTAFSWGDAESACVRVVGG